MNGKSQQEYIDSVRAKVAQLARGMLDGSVNYLEGANRLSVLQHDAGVADDDQDFTVFALISSETDALPIGNVKKHWAEEALKRNAQKRNESIKWAKEMSEKHCEALVRRFGGK